MKVNSYGTCMVQSIVLIRGIRTTFGIGGPDRTDGSERYDKRVVIHRKPKSDAELILVVVVGVVGRLKNCVVLLRSVYAVNHMAKRRFNSFINLVSRVCRVCLRLFRSFNCVRSAAPRHVARRRFACGAYAFFHRESPKTQRYLNSPTTMTSVYFYGYFLLSACIV